MSLTLNYALLVLQAALLVSVITFELLRRRNLVAVLLFLALLIVVEPQAWFVLGALQAGEPAKFFDNLITFDGFSLANVVLTLSVLTTLAVYAFGRQAKVMALPAGRPGLPETRVSYIAVTLLTLAAAVLLVRLLGGVRNLTHALGIMKGGQVFFVTGIMLGKMPLLYKLAYRRPAGFRDWALYAGAVFLVLLNSRGTAVYALAQLLLVYHYCVRRLLPRQLIAFGAAVMVMVIGYGSVRTYASLHGQFSAAALGEYYAHFHPVENFFHLQVGVFSGLAGIISAYLESGITYDFGVYNLLVVTHLIPNAIRSAALGDMERWLAASYPYHGSVVPGGYEAAFAHFGFLGVFLLSIALGVLPTWLHNRLASPDRDRLQYAILSIYILNLVMGAVWLALAFAIPDLALLALYRLILVIGARRLSGPHPAVLTTGA